MRALAAIVLPRPVAAALVVVGALIPVTAPAVTGTAVCAAATGPHAALVIDTGAGVHPFCVALDATSVSGIHLIELAGAQDHLAYGFGSGGQAVCRLAGVGPQGDDCFADYPDFWGYWHGDGRGGWTWSSSGAASAQVIDGALDAWVWGSGDSGATHAKPPSVGIDDVCVPSAATGAPSSAVRSSASPASTASGLPAASRSTTSSSGDPKTVTPSERGSPTVAALAAAPGPPPGGSPGPGLLVALVLGTALAGGGWLRLRSGRRARSPG